MKDKYRIPDISEDECEDEIHSLTEEDPEDFANMEDDRNFGETDNELFFTQTTIGWTEMLNSDWLHKVIMTDTVFTNDKHRDRFFNVL